MDVDQPPVVRIEADPGRPLPPGQWPADIPAVAQLLRDGLTLPHTLPLLAALLGATVLQVGEWGLRERPWQDHELVRRWQRFVATPEAHLRHLAADRPLRRGAAAPGTS